MVLDATIGIFPENIASLRVHESLGFRTVGHREKNRANEQGLARYYLNGKKKQNGINFTKKIG